MAGYKQIDSVAAIPTQWKPGQSGNLSGNHKGTKHVSTWIQKMLTDDKFVAMVQEGYEIKEYKGAPIIAIIKAQIKLALNSKDPNIQLKAAELLYKYGYGQKLQVSGDPENPLFDIKHMQREDLEDAIRGIIGRAASTGGAVRQSPKKITG